MRTGVVVLAIAVVLAAGAAAGQDFGAGQGPEGAWAPPPCTGLFTDVPCSSQFAAWVEQFARDGVTSGCDVGLYCPESPVTRRQMAVFVERAMRGTSTWPLNTVVVHAVAGTDGSMDPVASGQALVDAIASIPTTAPTMPGSANPWHVILSPGIFLVDSPIVVPAYTSLEGSGELTTRIQCSNSSAAYVVRVSQGTTLRNVMVSRTAGASGSAVAVTCVDVAATIEDSYLNASGGSTTNAALFNDGCTLHLDRSTAYASGGATAYGVLNDRGLLELQDSGVYGSMGSAGSYGVANLRPSGSCSLYAAGSKLFGTTATVTSDAGSTIRIAASWLNGGPVSGPATCAGVWDETYAFSPSTCP